MNIGINMGCYAGLSVDEQLRLMKENGFETCFLGSEFGNFETVVEKIKGNGIIIESLHAPFGNGKSDPVCSINSIWQEGEAGDNMLARLKDAVDKACANNVGNIVVHLSSGVTPPMINSIGNERFGELVRYATEHGVIVAFENQRMLGNIAHAFEYYKEAKFCWDIGHESCFTPGRSYMPLFGKKLAMLHVQDNMGAEGEHPDMHLIPFDGVVDFDAAARAIAETDFSGSVMLEILTRNSNVYDEMSAEEYYARAAKAARRIADRVEYYRQNKN